MFKFVPVFLCSSNILNSTSIATELMSYLEKERSYLPWLSTTLGVGSSLKKYEITKEKKYDLIVVNYSFITILSLIQFSFFFDKCIRFSTLTF